MTERVMPQTKTELKTSRRPRRWRAIMLWLKDHGEWAVESEGRRLTLTRGIQREGDGGVVVVYGPTGGQTTSWCHPADLLRHVEGLCPPPPILGALRARLESLRLARNGWTLAEYMDASIAAGRNEGGDLWRLRLGTRLTLEQTQEGHPERCMFRHGRDWIVGTVHRLDESLVWAWRSLVVSHRVPPQDLIEAATRLGLALGPRDMYMLEKAAEAVYGIPASSKAVAQ